MLTGSEMQWSQAPLFRQGAVLRLVSSSQTLSPRKKTQNSWPWELNLLQHLHCQKRIHLTCSRSSFSCAMFLLIFWDLQGYCYAIWRIYMSGIDCVSWIWKAERHRGSINVLFGWGVYWQAWAHFLHRARSWDAAMYCGSAGATVAMDTYVIRGSIPNAE